MNVTSDAAFIRLTIGRGVTDEGVERKLRSIWIDIQRDPSLRAEAIAAGFAPADLDAPGDPPFRAGPDAGRFGIAETILICVAGGLAKEAVQRLWDAVIWPRLKKQFGSDLNQGATDRAGG